MLWHLILVEVNKWRNRKSLLQTLIRERNGSEKSWFLQGNACQGNSSKLQSLTAGVCRTSSPTAEEILLQFFIKE